MSQRFQCFETILEVNAFVIVLSFINVHSDDTHRGIFYLLKKMLPKTVWYCNIAIVWTFYSETIEREFGITKEQRRY